jgi:hypothetical protein
MLSSQYSRFYSRYGTLVTCNFHQLQWSLMGRIRTKTGSPQGHSGVALRVHFLHGSNRKSKEKQVCRMLDRADEEAARTSGACSLPLERRHRQPARADDFSVSRDDFSVSRETNSLPLWCA